jgi:hypothetical protein
MAILRIRNDGPDVGQTEIIMYDGYDEAYTLIYDKSGKLLSYQTKDELGYPIADNINKAVSAKNMLYLPTTDKQNLIKYVKQLSPENIIELDSYYEWTYGESLEEAIKKEIGLDKNIKKALLEHLSNCFEKAIGCNTKYENKNSQITNPYYTGDKFTISCKNNKITVMNVSSKQQYNLDLEILLQDFPLREKALLKKSIQNLPAEVLADLAIEIDADDLNFGKKIKSTLFSKEIVTGGSYRIGSNSITLNTQGGSTSTLVHELGHAVDYMPYVGLNLSSIKKNSEFNTTFEKEMSNYIKAGYCKYDESSTEYIRTNDKKNKTSNYATASKQEMFAECYTLLMTGSCDSQDVIEDYFPETLKVIKTHISNIHKMKKNIRN